MRRLLFLLLMCCALTIGVDRAFADEPVSFDAPVLRDRMLRTERVFPVAPLHSDLPARYAQLRYGTSTYETLDDAYAGRQDSWLSARDTWVSVYEIAPYGDEVFYRSNKGWIHANALHFAPPSELRGITLQDRADEQLALVYWPTAEVHSQPNGAGAGTLEGYDIVTIFEEAEGWYRIGEGRWIHNRYVRHIVPGERPARVAEDEKWIEVDLSEQVVIAHEGDTPVYATLSATGLPPRWPTVQGLFRIWVKLDATRMYGGSSPADEYRLEEVPWTMFFYQDYGIHGTYWHDKFGAPRSHGCVNLSPADSRWFYEWAEPAVPADVDHVRSSEETPGTWVWVHQ